MIEIAELVLRAEAMGVRVEWGRDLPVPAEYDHARRVIRMADGRGDCVTRCSLAHELGHAALMHEPGGDYIAQERSANMYAAKLLISVDAYRRAERIVGHDPRALAKELDVTLVMIVAWRMCHKAA